MDLLGRGEDASGYADYLLLHQQTDGRIQCMQKHWKETGVARLTLYRHARMTQDKDWLLQRWPQFARAVEAIRQSSPPAFCRSPVAQLSTKPRGFGDGGIGRRAEYTNNHWLLAGLKAAIEAPNGSGRPRKQTLGRKNTGISSRPFTRRPNATPRSTRTVIATSRRSWDPGRRSSRRAVNGRFARGFIPARSSPRTIP